MLELDRILQSQGFGTHRACVALIVAGKIAVKTADHTDYQVCELPRAKFLTTGLMFSVDGVVWQFRPHVYIALNKPSGYECSQQPKHHKSVLSLLPWQIRNRGVQCVGRLDQDTTGLLLLSDDGQFIHTFTSPKKHVSKVYEATTKHPLDQAHLAALQGGVVLHDAPQPVAALGCQRLADTLLELTIGEGKYHQVKRMVAAAGNRVEALHRVKIGGYALPATLASGHWRWLEADDLNQLAELADLNQLNPSLSVAANVTNAGHV